MKKLYFMTVLLLLSGFSYAQNVNIPDANFKAYLVSVAAINTNLDSEIQISEAVAFTGEIVCDSEDITDLTGIQAFVNITALACNRNRLTSLDVSSNTALNRLTCYVNNITSLDVSKNTLLTYLDLGDNKLTSIDVSQNTNLTQLYLTANQLVNVNVKNGQNSKLINLRTLHNPNLTCIQVDNVANATTYHSSGNWERDVTASYSEICNPVVAIPDAAFKAYLVSNAAINTNGDSQIQVAEAEAFTGEIDCSSKGIADLTGIETFVNITQLRCQVNNLTVLDVSKNTALTEFACNNNNLTVLDLSKNIALTKIWVYSNQLTLLNLKNGNNTLLTTMHSVGNLNLSCIQVDNVATANSNNPSFWFKDAAASYSENCNSVMPVVLVSYTAKAAVNYALLQWQTASELNNKGFEIYRSANDGQFVKIGDIESGRNLNGNHYSFTDKAPLSGNNYYKLIQVDNDGKVNELGVRQVSFNFTSSIFSIHPNPTENLVSLMFSPNIFSHLQVIDLNGRILQRTAINAAENSKQVSLGAYPAGMYVIKLSGNGKAESHKISKK